VTSTGSGHLTLPPPPPIKGGVTSEKMKLLPIPVYLILDSTIAPVTIRFKRDSGSITFHPNVIS